MRKERVETVAGKVAKLVRKELKEKYPNTKFRVLSKTYTGGNSLRVLYTGGPSREELEAKLEKYEQGSFNGMTDMYEYTNLREGPQVKYLFVEREE